MEFNPKISLFKSARTNTPFTGEPSAETVLGFIQCGTYKKEVEAVRNATDKKDRDELKKQLNCITWSGTFSKRNADLQYLTSYSSLICHDIDKLDPDTLRTIKNHLVTDQRVYAAFISPSGNGLKVLFRTDTGIDSFLNTWIATAEYLAHKFRNFNVTVDAACKDVSRLCFVSFDENLHHYPAAKFIDHSFLEKWLPKADPVQTKNAIPSGSTAEIDKTDYVAKCHEIVTRTIQPVDGSFNAYINQFAIQANRYGLEDHQAADAIAYYCGWSQADKEDWAVIKSVYSKFANEKGKYLDGRISPYTGEKQTTKPKEKSSNHTKEAYNTSVKFWYMVAKMDKQGNIIKDQNGNEVGEYKFSYDDAIIFLQNNGFYKYRVGAGYQFVQIDKVNKHVEIVDELRIKEFMIDFLKTDSSNEYKQVREMFRRGAKNYCSTGILEGLEYYTPELTRDTATNAYVYFNNCFLDISKSGIAKKAYNEQQGYIWKRQMLDHQFDVTDYQGSDVNLFVWYAATGRKCDIKDRTPEEFQKYNALCTTIGYTLHRYKSPTLTKAVITTDKKLRSTGENNGRSGKSLIIKLIGRMLNVVTIDGRNFSFDKDFNFQKVNVDTALINFDDVKPNFDFSRLFSMITEEFSFEKKRIDLITIPFSDAPKFWISSNSTLKGGGESAIARQQIIEFSSYFNSSHQPATEFGRMFFYEWDADEWQRYYSFMVNCVKMYLDTGLIDFPLENYGLNKLIDTAGEEFVDYLDDTVLTQLQFTQEYDSQKLFEVYLTKINVKYPPKKNTFTKWVKMWAELHGLLINQHKPDGRDRRNCTDYLTFTKATPDIEPESDETLPF